MSDAVVPLAHQAGFRWMATDELILARSLGLAMTRDGYGHLQQPETLYLPYLVQAGEREIACMFRDHVLSDLIGFTYSNWAPQDAAADFVNRLVEGGRRYADRTGGGEATIPVILDGENAWEHFEGGGRPFLRALYRELSTNQEIRTVTMAEACRGATAVVNGLFPGSWINGDFYIWIGHPDDQRAWGQLADARQALDSPGPAADAASIVRAREELLVAEGSDWCWWYGDDHSSEHDLEFDDLFRRHLRNVYRALDKPVPDELFLTNITTDPPKAVALGPTGFVRPTLDGEVTSYFEWLGAGSLDSPDGGGSMHQVAESSQALVSAIQFGFDETRLFVRVDFRRRAADLLIGKAELRITLLTPADLRLRVGSTVRLAPDRARAEARYGMGARLSGGRGGRAARSSRSGFPSRPSRLSRAVSSRSSSPSTWTALSSNGIRVIGRSRSPSRRRTSTPTTGPRSPSPLRGPGPNFASSKSTRPRRSWSGRRTMTSWRENRPFDPFDFRL